MTAVVIQNPRRLGYIKRDKKRYTILRERRRYPALWAKAGAVPSLDLRFADNKSLVDAVSGQQLITFNRASSGTFVNSAGVIQTAATDVPRFDHNPITGESLGLLVEEQRTNLVLNSATFQPTSGGTPAAYTVDQVAPDGTTTGSRQTAANPRTLVDYIGIANALYTFSFYYRVTSGTAGFSVQLKNAQSDTVITSDTSPVATTTWRRFTISGTTTGATPGARIELVGVVPGFVFWGADLQAGAFPTSYIPTTTAAVTRSADVASITGSAFSGWYSQSEGTVYHQGRTPINANFFSIDDGTVDNRITSYMPSATAPAFFVGASGATQANISSSAITAGSMFAQASAYKVADFVIVTNGGTVSTDTSGSVPTVNRMVIGTNVSGTAAVNGTIRRLCFWPQRLTNSTLQSITS